MLRRRVPLQSQGREWDQAERPLPLARGTRDLRGQKRETPASFVALRGGFLGQRMEGALEGSRNVRFLISSQALPYISDGLFLLVISPSAYAGPKGTTVTPPAFGQLPPVPTTSPAAIGEQGESDMA